MAGRMWAGSGARIVASSSVAALLLLGIAGCGMQLETGYAYRPLNSTEPQRRAYYASPFSPEKSAAQKDKGGGGAGPSFGPSAVH